MRKLTTEEFIERAKEKHGTTYNYSKVVYVNTHTKVEIVCHKHGSFFQQPSDHFNGHGCLVCGNERNGIRNTHTKENFIEKAILKHGNTYKYDNVKYINSLTKVQINCLVHGFFFQTPASHIRGQGCYKCLYKNETACRESIEKVIGKKFPSTWPSFLEGLQYDGYNEELKIAIEYHGIQHYKPVKFFGGEKRFKIQQERDEKKLRLSKLNNITLIVVPYTVTNFEKYFEDYFYFM